MKFHPCMSSSVTGIRAIAPICYLEFPGGMVDLWHAKGEADGQGAYVSPDPRVLVLMDGAAPALELQLQPEEAWHRPRFAFIPADYPVRARMARAGQFRHMDLHFEQGRLKNRIAAFGSDPEKALAEPVLINTDEAALHIAHLLGEEIREGTHNTLLVESLSHTILARLLTRSLGRTAQSSGGLTPRQLALVRRLMRNELHRRIPISEMAAVAGLSESWFARAFRGSTGETPHRALQSLRIEAVQRLLLKEGGSITGIAAATGFADQAHLTRAFRAATGETPAQWRLARAWGGLQQDCSIPDCFSQDKQVKSP